MFAPSRRGRAALVFAERLLYGAAILLLAGWSAVSVGSRLYQKAAGRDLAHLLPSAGGAMGPADATRALAVEGKPFGLIEIPSLGLSAVIVEGANARCLLLGVGHIPGTSFPGEIGKVVLAAHRDTYFRPLKDARDGDLIQVTTPDGLFLYRIVSTRVLYPGQLEIVHDPAPGLTLITCYPFRHLGHAPQRFVVQAQPVGITLDPPPVALTTD